MRKAIPLLDQVFSLFVFATIIMLAVYMTLRLGTSGYNFFQDILTGGVWSDQSAMSESSKLALQGIAETVILIKAYRILVSYVKTHHISVEYIVEISIIAPAIELLFASHMYDLETKIILAIFGLANLFLYLKYFGPQHDEELHKVMANHKH